MALFEHARDARADRAEAHGRSRPLLPREKADHAASSVADLLAEGVEPSDVAAELFEARWLTITWLGRHAEIVAPPQETARA